MSPELEVSRELLLNPNAELLLLVHAVRGVGLDADPRWPRRAAESSVPGPGCWKAASG